MLFKTIVFIHKITIHFSNSKRDNYMETVCICMNISKEEIIETINSMDLTTVDDVGTFTMAGTCCGKCIPKIKELLKEAGK